MTVGVVSYAQTFRRRPMATRLKFRSPISEAVHEGISGLYRLGLVDEAVMRAFDKRCLIKSVPRK